jgi:hypothetical protein
MGGSDEEKYDHPTQKPVDLMRRPILNHLRRGELVYDPFLGSGTTLAAAELTERVCYGIELDPKYADVIVERWQQLSGKEAKLDGDGRTFSAVKAEPMGRTVIAASCRAETKAWPKRWRAHSGSATHELRICIAENRTGSALLDRFRVAEPTDKA